MQPKLFLRIAAAIMLLHTIGHTFGALASQQAPNTRVAEVIAGMNREHFPFQGRSVTLASFFNGYGIIMIFVLLLISIQLWMLSTSPVKNQRVAMGLFLLVLAVSEYIYFFPMAAFFTLAASICVWLTLAGTLPQPKKSIVA